MKRSIFFLLLISLFAIVSCNEKAGAGDPNVNVENLQKDFIKWWGYYNGQMNLSSDFTAIDNSSNLISKDDFLKRLTTGKYIPVKLMSKDTSETRYKLFVISEQSAEGVSSAIKNASILEYEHFKMEGQKFPLFSFTDLNGKTYNNGNTKGKVVVIKCWYISCVACVAEFPELNELVNQYKSRNDIVFVSLAFNDSLALKEFLLKKPFNYANVANQKSYLKDTLKVNQYPTHFVIDRNGNIVKIVNKGSKLKSIIAKVMKVDIPI